VLAGTRTRRVMAWDLATGAVTFDRDAPFKPPGSIVRAVGYLEDGTRFASSDSGTILWKNASNRSRVGSSILEELDGSLSVRMLILGYWLLVRDAGSIWEMASSAHH